MSNEEIGLSRNWLHAWELSKTCIHFSIKIWAAVNYLYSWRERSIDNVTKYRTQSYATASLLGLKSVLSDNWISVMLIVFFFLWVHKYYIFHGTNIIISSNLIPVSLWLYILKMSSQFNWNTIFLYSSHPKTV